MIVLRKAKTLQQKIHTLSSSDLVELPLACGMNSNIELNEPKVSKDYDTVSHSASFEGRK